MLEELGYNGLSVWTDRALNLHDYQYNGPDPDAALSKYRNREEASKAVMSLIKELIRRIDELKQRIKLAMN